MASLSKKQLAEKNTFIRFAERLSNRGEWLIIENRPEPEPDLLCRHKTDGNIAFELVSLTDPLIAELLAAGTDAYQGALQPSDPSERIIRKKLHRRYETTADRVDLLVYTEGRLITSDDVIIPTILPWFDAIDHQFLRVWFMGEMETCCLWKRNSYEPK